MNKKNYTLHRRVLTITRRSKKLKSVAFSALWQKTLNRTSRDPKKDEALMKSKSLAQDVAIKIPKSLVGPLTHQDSKAIAMTLKAAYLTVATTNKWTYLSTQ